jgi:hypothetical protein
MSRLRVCKRMMFPSRESWSQEMRSGGLLESGKKGRRSGVVMIDPIDIIVWDGQERGLRRGARCWWRNDRSPFWSGRGLTGNWGRRDGGSRSSSGRLRRHCLIRFKKDSRVVEVLAKENQSL